MDFSASISGLGSVEDDEGTLLESMKISDNHPTEDAFSMTEPERHESSTNEISRSISIEDTHLDRSPVGTSARATMATEKNLEVKQGVTLCVDEFE